ncbi:MAG: hypothetical protein J3K34DRAFT_198201 [Monoraphidium minutum]|nr:MAG: hypothetical protein J3K34DRAFT_198201 [Monoraphidium minutum]
MYCRVGGRSPGPSAHRGARATAPPAPRLVCRASQREWLALRGSCELALRMQGLAQPSSRRSTHAAAKGALAAMWHPLDASAAAADPRGGPDARARAVVRAPLRAAPAAAVPAGACAVHAARPAPHARRAPTFHTPHAPPVPQPPTTTCSASTPTRLTRTCAPRSGARPRSCTQTSTRRWGRVCVGRQGAPPRTLHSANARAAAELPRADALHVM